jgi:hypothetical protein
VDFVKLDVEGAELSVLRGATQLLVRKRPVLLVEVSQVRTIAWGYDAEEIVHFLQRTGYDLFQILDEGKLSPVAQIAQGEMNVVGIPRGFK